MKRDFTTGSEWLYYKIYCGYGTADELLRNVVAPLSITFKSHKMIDNWFFIRYTDPNPHLRWRLHFYDLSELGNVELAVAQALQPYLDCKQVNKVMTDTYKREIERYGETTMELCEQIFGFDSEMTTKMLAFIDVLPEKETYRWLFSLKAIDSMLADFGYETERRHKLSKTIADAFGHEFGINEMTIKQFSDKYRAAKNRIFKFMRGEDEVATALYATIEKRSCNMEEAVARFHRTSIGQQRLNEIMQSLIHMTMNRIFIAQQRKHEVILYGFLERYYRSEIAKKKYLEKTDLQNSII